MRRIVVVLMAVFGLVATAAPAGGVAGFGDVEPGRFFTESVQWMVDNDITTGTSRACFSPDNPVTRGQAAAFLWRMEGFPEGAPPHPFSDVVADWQQKPVSWMADEEITTGTSATTYSPDATLTRGQMAALVWRAAGEPAGAPPHPFVDVFKDWQQGPVSWMADEEITTGTSATTFSPDDPVTRGQFAAFSYRWKGEPAVVLKDASPLCLGRDEFDGPLAQGWTWENEDPARHNFTDMPGYLRIRATVDAVFGEVPHNVLLRDPPADDYEIETKVSFASPVDNFQHAGLMVREDAKNNLALTRAYCGVIPPCVGDGIYFDNNVDGGDSEAELVALPPGTGDVWLRIRHKGGTYTGSYSLDGSTWVVLGSFDRVLADAKVGIWTGGAVTESPPADFGWFEERVV